MQLKNARVLVTGGAGAIGSNVVRALLKRGSSVSVLDDLSSGRERDIPKDAVFYRMSVLDEKVRHLIQKTDVVIHLAARFANQNSIDHPVDDLSVNALGTLRVLEACRREGVGKFIYASTSCVTQLRTPYAISKLTGEQYARFYGEQHGIPVNVVRYFNSYGPFDYPGQYRSVIPNFFATAMKGQPLTIFGEGNETRDFTYVEDVAEVTVRAAESDAVGHVIDVGGGAPVTIARLAQLINDVTGNGAGVIKQPRRSWDSVKDRRADPTVALMELGYAPSTPIEVGLVETFGWLRSIDYVSRR